MNTDYVSYETAARRDRDHAHTLVTHGTALSQTEPHGSTAGVVCLLCWDFAESVADLHCGHVPHHVPGTDHDLVGCCPDHDVRPRHTLRPGRSDAGVEVGVAGD